MKFALLVGIGIVFSAFLQIVLYFLLKRIVKDEYGRGIFVGTFQAIATIAFVCFIGNLIN